MNVCEMDTVFKEKIKKVKNLADRAGTEGEAQAAVLALQRLMARYDFDIADVMEEDDIPEKKVEDLIVDEYGKQQHWRGWLASVICSNFRCTVYWKGDWKYNGNGKRRKTSKMQFVGISKDVLLAKEAFLLTQAAIDRMFKRRHAQRIKEFGSMALGDAIRMKNSYIAGFITGLQAALKEQVETVPGMGLVLVKDPMVKEYVRDLRLTRGAGTTTQYHGDRDAHEQGRKDGQAFNNIVNDSKVKGPKVVRGRGQIEE